MLYFSSRNPPISKIDPAQLAKVEAFKREFGPTGAHPGLYRTFKSKSEFERLLHQHLMHIAFDLAGGSSHAELISNFVDIPVEDWDELFRDSNTGSFLVMYSSTWRNTYLQQLKSILQRNGEIRFILPSVSDTNQALPLMADRIGARVIELKGRILEAKDAILKMGRANIRFTKRYFSHSLYLFDKGGIVALYSYIPDRSPSPAARIALGPIYNQCLTEFNYLYDQALEDEYA